MTYAVLFGTSLVVRWVWLWMDWSQDRVRRQMLRNVARIMDEHKAQSRPGGGSTIAGQRVSPGALSGRAGVEPAVAPPAHPVLVGAARRPHAHAAPTRLPLTPVGAGETRSAPAPTGHHRPEA